MDKLAIEGGRPVRGSLLPYARQLVEQEDVEAVLEVLRSDWLTTGPAVSRFEEEFAARVGARFAVAVSSGTAALHAAAHAAGLAAGDEAIVPALTFAASANCVRYQGGHVTFADVRPDTLTLDVREAEANITARTRAIVTVDYAGQPSDLAPLLGVAQQRGLVLIEDASHALGATYRGRLVGSVAHLTTFSLHPVKHITTGEGGVVTTDDAELAERLRRFRSHGIVSDHRERAERASWLYEMVELGYNYRLSDLQAALGRAQLAKLDRFIERRRWIARRYSEAFAGLPELEVPVVLPDRTHAWHLYVVGLRLERLRVGRGDVFRALRAENIGVNVHYIPVPWHPYYQSLGYAKGQWPVAEAAYERILSLPLFPAMTDQDVEDVIAAVGKVLRAFRA